MEQITSIFFSILIFIFGFIIISNMLQEKKEISENSYLKSSIDSIYFKIDRFCKDPFSPNFFSIESKKEIELYLKEDKICAKNEKDIYCQKSDCIFEDKIIFEKNEFERKINCKMKSEGNQIKMECS